MYSWKKKATSHSPFEKVERVAAVDNDQDNLRSHSGDHRPGYFVAEMPHLPAASLGDLEQARLSVSLVEQGLAAMYGTLDTLVAAPAKTASSQNETYGHIAASSLRPAPLGK